MSFLLPLWVGGCRLMVLLLPFSFHHYYCYLLIYQHIRYGYAIPCNHQYHILCYKGVYSQHDWTPNNWSTICSFWLHPICLLLACLWNRHNSTIHDLSHKLYFFVVTFYPVLDFERTNDLVYYRKCQSSNAIHKSPLLLPFGIISLPFQLSCVPWSNTDIVLPSDLETFGRAFDKMFHLHFYMSSRESFWINFKLSSLFMCSINFLHSPHTSFLIFF